MKLKHKTVTEWELNFISLCDVSAFTNLRHWLIRFMKSLVIYVSKYEIKIIEILSRSDLRIGRGPETPGPRRLLFLFRTTILHLRDWPITSYLFLPGPDITQILRRPIWPAPFEARRSNPSDAGQIIYLLLKFTAQY